jgi:ubiquinone/menaquinone biosynthesis C-methylase UbiE
MRLFEINKIKLIFNQLPQEFNKKIRKIYFILLKFYLMKVLKRALKSGIESLDYKDFKGLLKRYINNKTNYPKYDRESIRKRNLLRIKNLFELLKLADIKIHKCLELGCREGELCLMLKKLNIDCSGIDINPSKFNQILLNKGIDLIEMDANNLNFGDNSFDLVISYNSFEHFLNPERVLKEAIRVVKPKGYIFIAFNPLYSSPWGLHAYKSTPIPYSQFLFDIETIKKGTKIFNNLDQFKLSQLNKWDINKYRNLWRKYEKEVEIVYYNESYDFSHRDIIFKYPYCFTNKINHIESLFVCGISILLQKSENYHNPTD